MVGNNECKYCKKSFTFERSLATHIRYSHSNEKMHKCAECPVIATTPKGLQEHVRIHTGEKPHICQTCGMKFRTRLGFRHHNNLHK